MWQSPSPAPRERGPARNGWWARVWKAQAAAWPSGAGSSLSKSNSTLAPCGSLKKIAIKPARRLEIVAQDGEMVHRRNRHQQHSLIDAINRSDAYSQAGCGVNEPVRRRRPHAASSHRRGRRYSTSASSPNTSGSNPVSGTVIDIPQQARTATKPCFSRSHQLGTMPRTARTMAANDLGPSGMPAK